VFREDFLLRELKRVIDGIARALKKSKDGAHPTALQELGAIYDDILGERRPLLEHTDSKTLATLCGTPERVAAVALALAAEGQVAADTGDATAALLKRAKATELMLEAIELGYDDEGAIDEWSVPAELLSPRARSLLLR
jgi:hypothetical protein